MLIWQYRVPNPVLFGRFRSSGPDIPTDVVTASLFESMYVHPIMKKSLIPWRYYDAFVKYTLWLVSGTKHGIDQWIGGLPDEKYHTSEREVLAFFHLNPVIITSIF
jgi:dimethylaniline monooxygenase (N-oxide forming)